MEKQSYQFDAGGHRYSVHINAHTLRRVRQEHGINLYSAQDDNFALISRLDSDPVDLAAVLWTICEPQARDNDVTPEAFFTAIAGDVLLEANAALWRGVAESFPEPGRRRAFHQIMNQAGILSTRICDLIGDRLATLSPDQNFTISFGNSAGSADSTPAPTRSPNSSKSAKPNAKTTGTTRPRSGRQSPTPSAAKTRRRPTRPTSTRYATTATTPTRTKPRPSKSTKPATSN